MPAAVTVKAVVVSCALASVCTGVTAPPPESMRAAAAAQWLRTDAGLSITLPHSHIACTRGLPTVVPFNVAHAAPFARAAHARSADDRIASVIDAGQVAPNAHYGFAVIEGAGEGTTTVTIAGVPVEVTVTRATSLPGLSERPRIVAPVDGAAAWGTIGVCIAWWRPTAPTGAVPGLAVGDRVLQAVWTSEPSEGPIALAAYELDTVAGDSASLTLAPVWPETDGAGPEALPARSDAVSIRITPPGDGRLLSGECEAKYQLPPLPEDREERNPSIGSDRTASGGKFFSNAGASPHFRFPIEVPGAEANGAAHDRGAGWYQVVLTAGGDPACSALPAVGITIDEAQYPVTRSSIAMPAFHRASTGVPFLLTPGPHVIRVDFLNDLYVGGGGADRNLRLDKIEVLRVADADSNTLGAGAPSESMMTMSGDSMTAMTGGQTMSAAGDAMTSGGGGGMGEPGAAPASDSWPASAAARAAGGDPPVVAFARPLDGATIAGDLELRSLAWWPGISEKHAAPPRTSLLLNGRNIADQIAAAPRFIVPWSAFEPGENRLSLVAQGAAFSARSAEATVFVRKPPTSQMAGTPAPGGAAAGYHRFTVHDPRWDAASRKLITQEQSPPERVCFGMWSNVEATLTLPAALAGEYEIDIEARGQGFRGAPELAVTLETDGLAAPTPVGTLAVSSSWDPQPVPAAASPAGDRRRPPATIMLNPGPKRLKIAFINDLYEEGKGDRNVFIQALALRPHRATGADAEPPKARITYPADGRRVRAGAADAVVFEVDGSIAARNAEVMIDGEPTGQVVDLRGRVGPHIAPVSLRSIAPGPHQVAIRTEDARSRRFTSPAIAVTAIAAPGEPTDYERAIILLDRFGFGPDESELAAALTLGIEGYLQARLSDGPDAARVRSARDLAAARYPGSSSAGDVQRRAVLEAIATDNPVRQRFVLWTENHFSTWIRKTEARRKADEHDRFSRLGIAPFNQLLLASATSPAMLRYLDQEQSYARRLNENYAREIMELHTLGVHGGYSQEDVTTLARILTGWTTTREGFVTADTPGEDGVGPDQYGMRESFRFAPSLGDPRARTFLGREFPAASPGDRFDRVLTAMGMLANHPSTARFISTKLAEHFLAFPAPDDLVERLASTFERTGGDMREMLLSMARDPEFWSTPPGKRLCHPPDFAFRLARCSGSMDAQAVHEYLNLSGHAMFDRSTPDGYQENDAESMDSNAMLQRWKFARRLEPALVDLLPTSLRAGDKPLTEAELQRGIDLVAMRLTGRLLGDASNTAAMNLAHEVESAGGRRDDRWRTLATFVASTPEVQLK